MGAIAISKLHVMACKGELNFLCKCLTLEQLLWIISEWSDLSPEEIKDRFELVCCLTRGIQPAGPVPNAAAVANACLGELLAALCSEQGRKALKTADFAIDVLLAMPGIDLFPVTKRLASVVSIAIDAALFACDNRTLTASGARMFCSVVGHIDRIRTEGGAAVRELIGPVADLFNVPTVSAGVKKCCADPQIQAAPLPDWWPL